MSQPRSIGVLSDTHSQLDLLDRLAELMRTRGVELLIHCGDITSSRVIRALRDFDVHWVFGNCDRDRQVLEQEMRRWGHHCHGIRGELRIAGKLLAFSHGDNPILLQNMLLDPQVDLVLHGHTHLRRDEIIDGSRVLCPGALTRVRIPTAVILSLPGLDAEFLDIQDDAASGSPQFDKPAR